MQRWPRTRPIEGLSFGVRLLRAMTGHELQLEITTIRRVRTFRLLGVVCDELSTPSGREAQQYTAKILHRCGYGTAVAWSPDPSAASLLFGPGDCHLLPVVLYLNSSRTLNEMLIASKHGVLDDGPPAPATTA